MVDFALLRDPENGAWSLYRRPQEVVIARCAKEVVDALRRVETAVNDRGFDAVGYIGYEAAPAFDTAHRVVAAADGLPLLSFGLFPSARDWKGPAGENGSGYVIDQWTPSQNREIHRRSVDRIRSHIAAGDTYQVNHTFRMRAPFSGDPRSFFIDLVGSQPRSYAAYLDCGGYAVCSASPELFFRLDGRRLLSRPMKGTADRGWDRGSDRDAVERLRASEKDRAENAMIVDMVRNDIGRVAKVGSVRVADRFDVERHPTVLQMTTTVEAETDASIVEIVAALFPFASVTGAPKIRTMEIISELENEPRGVYTGAIGVIQPGRRARFSVAIRTAVVDRAGGEIEYGVGSGIVWDSTADEEFAECAVKARVLEKPAPAFDLLETILWQPGSGYSLIERHLDRLSEAGEYFCRPVSVAEVYELLGKRAEAFGDQPYRVRLLVADDGSVRIEALVLDADSDAGPVRLGLAREPVQLNDPFLHFKTTHREIYDRARESRPDCDDVLLWNPRGEATESTIANLVARIDGELVTPPVSCGLLGGTFRAELLSRGEICERVIRVEELPEAEALFLVNSVQEWRRVEWVTG